MNYHLINIAISLLDFGVFCFLQAVLINGIKAAADEGMVLVGFKKWVIENAGEFWGKPLILCVRCMSSVYGFITYWPAVLVVFGFAWWEVPVFVADVFILVCLNWFIYKKI